MLGPLGARRSGRSGVDLLGPNGEKRFGKVKFMNAGRPVMYWN